MVDETTTIKDAFNLMVKMGYSGLPIEENGKVRLGRYGNSHNQMVFDPHCEFPALLLTLKQLGISRIHFR